MQLSIYNIITIHDITRFYSGDAVLSITVMLSLSVTESSNLHAFVHNGIVVPEYNLS